MTRIALSCYPERTWVIFTLIRFFANGSEWQTRATSAVIPNKTWRIFSHNPPVTHCVPPSFAQGGLFYNYVTFIAYYYILWYNISKQDFLTVFLPAVMPTFTFTRLIPESMKGGLLMKNKHIAKYGKKIALCIFRSYHFTDNFFHKSTITALLAQGQLL